MSPSLSIKHYESEIAGLVTPSGPWASLHIILSIIERHGGTACLFGGAVRDLITTDSCKPRDFDVVVDRISPDLLEKLLKEYVVGKNRFGGLRLRVPYSSNPSFKATSVVPMDVWCLCDTWAFRQGHVSPPSFRQLPKTTFLNTDAVAAVISLTGTSIGCGATVAIYEHNFFHALDTKTLEINLEQNPDPQQCVVRAIMAYELLRTRYGTFTMGENLSAFLIKQAKCLGKNDYYKIMIGLYGKSSKNRAIFRMWHDSLKKMGDCPPTNREARGVGSMNPQMIKSKLSSV
jgi:hypothetical protein